MGAHFAMGAQMALSETQARNAKPKDKPYKLTDANGLYLHVFPNGSRYWRLKYRFAGKEKKYAIGVYPEVSLADAREETFKARKLIKEGIDPVIDRQVNKAKNIEKHQITFQVLANEWIEKNAGKWSSSYTDKIKTLLSRNITPKIGKYPITSLTPALVLNAIQTIEARGALEQASRALRSVKAVCRYATVKGVIDRSPVADLHASEALIARQKKNYPYLTRKEVGDFLRRLTEYHGRPETRIAVNFLLLTAVRTGEMRAARWEEIDLKRKEWRIPAERMKTRREHVVPLSRQAIALLKELKEHTGYSQYLFPGAGRSYFSENTINKAIKLLGYGGRVVGHGFRATFSTIANEEDNNFSPDVIERALAHAERNEIRASYNHAQHLKQRRALMQWWADELDVLQHGGGV